MKTSIIDIGGSKGIILPQSFLEKCMINEEVNIEVKHHLIVISAVQNEKRGGWAEAFRQMAEKDDDVMLISDIFEDEDLTDWTWN